MATPVVPQVVDQQLLKGFSTNINTMQQVLEEAGRLLKLVWRVSLPSGLSVDGTQSHQVRAALVPPDNASLLRVTKKTRHFNAGRHL